MIANILHEIQQFQYTPYPLKAEPSIQDYLLSHDTKGEMGDNQFEDFLYDQSVEIEPRDQPYKKSVCYNIILAIVVICSVLESISYCV